MVLCCCNYSEIQQDSTIEDSEIWTKTLMTCCPSICLLWHKKWDMVIMTKYLIKLTYS